MHCEQLAIGGCRIVMAQDGRPWLYGQPPPANYLPPPPAHIVAAARRPLATSLPQPPAHIVAAALHNREHQAMPARSSQEASRSPGVGSRTTKMDGVAMVRGGSIPSLTTKMDAAVTSSDTAVSSTQTDGPSHRSSPCDGLPGQPRGNGGAGKLNLALLSGLISHAQSVHELLWLHETHRGMWDHMHAANVWNKLPKLGRQGDASDERHEAQIRRLLEHTLELISSCNARALANINCPRHRQVQVAERAAVRGVPPL